MSRFKKKIYIYDKKIRTSFCEPELGTLKARRISVATIILAFD
jgi:hypothetical protein